MARRKKEIKFYNYECSLTGEKFKRYRKVQNADELMSVPAYYELNQDEDDRPEIMIKKLGLGEIELAASESEEESESDSE